MDCWDGPNGQPIIYHGRTLTTKILFRPVIEAIAKYAFVASPYPVILSLENHCSVEQQVTMTKILREVLGDLLLLKPILDSETELPSPESMKGKVIVKGKIVCIEPSESEDYFVDSDDDETVENNVEDEPRKRLVSGASSKLSESPSESLMPRSSSSAKPKKFVVAKALSDLVIYCRAKRFEGLSDALSKLYPFYFICYKPEMMILTLYLSFLKSYRYFCEHVVICRKEGQRVICETAL